MRTRANKTRLALQFSHQVEQTLTPRGIIPPRVEILQPTAGAFDGKRFFILKTGVFDFGFQLLDAVKISIGEIKNIIRRIAMFAID